MVPVEETTNTTSEMGAADHDCSSNCLSCRMPVRNLDNPTAGRLIPATANAEIQMTKFENGS